MIASATFGFKAIAMTAILFMESAVGAPTDPREVVTSRRPSNPKQWNNTQSPASGQAFGGDLTWFDTGLGACGWFNYGGDHICAVSHIVFDRANIDGNPNHNPLCGRRIHIQRGDIWIDVTLVDRCEGCAEFDIDVSRGVFEQLGNLDEGRVHTDWWWI
ncbi:Barwin-related endoglucanase [Penicillium cf. griseofulvum]|uniref:Barwin-related endoglucanase n=1 Tax=Penicillium cf. griseofulvum TaxID=2972120 RepID=A0A9W9JNP1_9EURO|nr:Barwin-related endoglucanase [Penicillium cf. griseofulvum]KAJ5424259.1 Barwin-related endoglucanase [Penicillium cf. griseofulvum]